jgi:hypothetical protein
MQPDSSTSTVQPRPPWLKLRIAASTLIIPGLGMGNMIVVLFKKVVKLDVLASQIAALKFVRANTTWALFRYPEYA